MVTDPELENMKTRGAPLERRAAGEIAALRECLKDCADALAEEVEGHYRETKGHPAMKRRYDRDMAPALAAYKLLGVEKEPTAG